ncbi:MAG: VCBS repeat-containing protein [Chryseolinea sp.]
MPAEFDSLVMACEQVSASIGFWKSARLICILAIACMACKENKETKTGSQQPIKESMLSGQELATVHCGRCHSLVDPSELPRSSWKNDVLPSMGHRMGIYKGDHQPDSLFDQGISGTVVRRANIYPEQAVLAKEDWNKIVSYYLSNAYDTILPPKKDKRPKNFLKHFKYREVMYSHRPALTSLVKILPGNRGIVYSDGKLNKSILTFLTSDLQKNYDIPFPTTPISYYEKSDTLYLTMAGNGVFPNDIPAGSLQKISKSKNSKTYDRAKVVLTKMQRPVHMAYGDLDNDGDEDIVACEYGDLTGKLVWFQNMGHDRYLEKSLRGTPGAIGAVIKDVDKDGFNDIIVLMAQGDEGVFLYTNKKNGFFTERRLLSFSPLNGSQYIELADFNKDGFDDLIYVSGDNADLTPILKQHHGIYIFLNDGEFNFTQRWFYQLNGAYKAMARDYDLDGDLDIAAISFFPDYHNYPEESFVYLENKGNLKFVDYSFPQSTNGRWIVMDAADMDADGDVDIALGSFVYFTPQGDTTGLGKKWLTAGPSVIVLENTSRHR